jgi:4-carboxymuconolactone decarboxylase
MSSRYKPLASRRSFSDHAQQPRTRTLHHPNRKQPSFRYEAAVEMAEHPDRAAIEHAQQVLYDEGMKLRGLVLGAAHLKDSKSHSEFQQPMQSMAVSAGWSLCWTRPGLERKTRSLLCLVMLSVLGRDHELGVHVRGAIKNGCTEEIREALVQVCFALHLEIGKHLFVDFRPILTHSL